MVVTYLTRLRAQRRHHRRLRRRLQGLHRLRRLRRLRRRASLTAGAAVILTRGPCVLHPAYGITLAIGHSDLVIIFADHRKPATRPEPPASLQMAASSTPPLIFDRQPSAAVMLCTGLRTTNMMRAPPPPPRPGKSCGKSATCSVDGAGGYTCACDAGTFGEPRRGPRGHSVAPCAGKCIRRQNHPYGSPQ
jgi:hypothetical protein